MFVYEGGVLSGTKHPLRGDSGGHVEVSLAKAMHSVYQAMLVDEDISAATPYVLVDLSDDTNFPHTDTTSVWLKKLAFNAELSGDAQFNVYVGVVVENDGTDGSVTWIAKWNMERVDNPTDGTDRFDGEADFCVGGDPRGIDLTVSANALSNVVSNSTQDDSVNWQNDVARASPVGTSNPGEGDLVMLIDPVSAAWLKLINFSMTALYFTE